MGKFYSVMKIYIIRHGETIYNRNGIIQGHKDVPLSEEGIRQAQKASVFYADEIEKNRLNVIAVYSSDLVRASRTAEEFTNRLKQKGINIPIYYKKELREIYLGEWEGKSYSQLDEETMINGISLFRIWMKEPFKTVVPGMESMMEFFRRAVSVVSEIASYHISQNSSDRDAVVIFTHGGIVRMIQNHAMGREPGNFIWAGTPNLAGIVLDMKNKIFNRDCFTMENLNGWETVVPGSI